MYPLEILHTQITLPFIRQCWGFSSSSDIHPGEGRHCQDPVRYRCSVSNLSPSKQIAFFTRISPRATQGVLALRRRCNFSATTRRDRSLIYAAMTIFQPVFAYPTWAGFIPQPPKERYQVTDKVNL